MDTVLLKFSAKDVAIKMAQQRKIPIILASATPSLKMLHLVDKGKYKFISIPKRVNNKNPPKFSILNSHFLDRKSGIDTNLLSLIEKTVSRDKKVLIFINRRGYSPLSLCIECGHRYQCEQCTSWLVMHHVKKRLLCHHCGSIYPIKPNCPKCQSEDSIKLIGPGVERLEEELKLLFPDNIIGIMSSDNANTPRKIKTIIDDFKNKKTDILVATQIMAKGYHFPNLSFVGVIDADTGLLGGDMRAIERTYNLLQQVSGRAGRSNQMGRVFIQTYFPKQPVIQSLQKRDRQTFVQQSLQDRKEFLIPPFGFMTALIISGASKAKTEMYASSLTRSQHLHQETNILGPVEAPIFLLRGQYRFRLLIKGNSRKKVNHYTRILLKKCPPPPTIKLVVDVDPYSFM